MKKIIKIIIAVAIILFFTWLIWQRYVDKNKSNDIDQYNVSRSDIIETISASGEVSPLQYANLSFVAPALVTKISVDIGDTVKKDQKLIIINRNALFAEIQSAHIDVEKAEAAERFARRKWDDYKPEQKEQIKKDVEQARVRLRGVQAQLQNTEIVSPIDGIVTQNNIQIGEVAQGMVMRVINEDKMDIEVLMSETDAAKIHENQEAFATFDAYNDEQFSVSVTTIEPEATKLQDVTYYKTKFTLPTSLDKKILSGMSVDVDVVVNKKEAVLTVPLRFVRKNDSGEYVYIKDDMGEYQKKYITIGIEGDDGDVEINKGLNENEIVYLVRDEDIASK